MTLKSFDSDRIARQSAIETMSNPNTKIDYLCRHESEIGTPNTINITLCYVPGKLIISSESFGRYLRSLNISADSLLETLAHTILDDLNNELVPRWIQISLLASDHGLDRGHKILIEDRIPNWNNINLLNRLPSF